MKKIEPIGELLSHSLKKNLMTIRNAILLLFLGILQAHAVDAYSEKTRLSLNFTETTQSQQNKITGTITDEKGIPLPGVTVVVKGTTLGSLTDMSGKYTIDNAPKNATLVFSFIGMTTQEIASAGRIVIDAVLKEEAVGLDEVIVIGYGTQKKSDLTGSVTRVSMSDKLSQANVNLSQALSGASAGVNIEGRGGASSEPSLSIRGQTSLSATDQPLIVLDGIIYNGSMY